jgi:hypothetical protein
MAEGGDAAHGRAPTGGKFGEAEAWLSGETAEKLASRAVRPDGGAP